MLFTWGGAPLSIVVTAAFALLSLIIYRPFCRYFCPLGAFLGILSYLSPFKMKVDSQCVSCGVCQRVCPTGAVKGNSPKINPSECFLCGACVVKCRKKAISREMVGFPNTYPRPFFADGFLKSGKDIAN